MICPKCGKETGDNQIYCNGCGARIVPKEEVIKMAQSEYDPRTNAILVLGILSLSFALGKGFIVIVGLVLSLIAIVMAGRFKRKCGEKLYGEAKIGKILAIIALIIAIFYILKVTIVAVFAVQLLKILANVFSGVVDALKGILGI